MESLKAFGIILILMLTWIAALTASALVTLAVVDWVAGT